jgi:uncharacterized protein YecT (DUF1311 family)
METHSERPVPLARTQALTKAIRDLCFGLSAVWVALGVPSLIGTLASTTGPLGVDVSEVLAREVPPNLPDWQREERLKAGLGTRDMDECWERIDHGALRNTQEIACLLKEQTRLQTILDTEAAKLREASHSRTVRPMGAASRAWATFRDRWCELEAVRNQAPHPRVTELHCTIDLTRDFIILIRKAG